MMRQDTEFAPDMKVEIDVAADVSLLTEGHGTSAGKICYDEAGFILEV